MRKNIKFLMICAVLAGTGFALAAIGIAMGGIIHGIRINAQGIHVYAPSLDNNKKNGAEYEFAEETLEAFDNIEVDVEYADIRVQPSGSQEYTLSYQLSDDSRLQKEVRDGKLIVKNRDPRSSGNGFLNLTWFPMGDNMHSDHVTEYITIGLPENTVLSELSSDTESGDVLCEKIQADSLRIKSAYGDVSLQDVEAGQIELALESGKLQMDQVQGENCRIKGEYGDAAIRELALTKDLTIRLESGDLKFYETTMQGLNLDCDYGNIDGQQMEFTNAQMNLESGDCKLSDVLLEGCDIHADYGDVELQLREDLTDYAYNLCAEYGDIKIGGQKMGDSYATLGRNAQNLIGVQCESGNIQIN